MATEVAPALPLHRFDTTTYNEMVASGALEGEPIELLEGWLVDVMSPQSPSHAAVIEALTRHLAGADARLRVQLPLEIPPDSEPEPDLALVAGEPRADAHPRTALLAVEVAVGSHGVDRGVKARLYARAGIATYWLVDVPSELVEVRTEPGAEGYGRCERYASGSHVPSPVPGVADLDVGALLAGTGG